MHPKGKIIIISAPSGTGKSTVIKRLMEKPELRLKFSVSATSRKPRNGEINGKDYYFVSAHEFESMVKENKFLEWEEVYAGTCYGTLLSEVERITSSGDNMILDIDVKGAINVKKRFGKEALSIFLMPPSLEILAARLRNRGTDSDEVIEKRLGKAETEMSYAAEFDKDIVNDNLDETCSKVERLIMEFSSGQ